MKIIWHGNTCFTLRGKNTRVVINPLPEIKKLKGKVVLSSLKENGTVDEMEKLIDWPGEYEINGIPIVGFPAWTKSKSKEDVEGTAGDSTIIFYFELDGIKICHLGDLGHVLTSETVKDIGDVDILMMNLGEDSNLTHKKITEIVEAIEPRSVLTMGDDNFEKALKELGVEKIEKSDDFTIKTASELPDDKRIFISFNKK